MNLLKIMIYNFRKTKLYGREIWERRPYFWSKMMVR